MPNRMAFSTHPRRLLLTATLLACCAVTARADYTIQIGAFRNPTDQFAADARRAGPIYLTERAGGIKALSAGRFTSKADAEGTLIELKEYYPDAFVSELSDRALAFAAASELAARAGYQETSSATAANLPNADSSSDSSTDKDIGESSTAAASSRPVPSSSEQGLLDRLTEDERRRVVYLDGVLHVKSGKTFIPLTEYPGR